MHELSVINALLEQVHEHVPEGARLLSVLIEVGALEHLDDEIMQLGWVSTVAEHAGFEEAALHIEHSSLVIKCRSCGHEFMPDDMYAFACPECAAVLPDVVEGRGVLLKSLEVDEVPTKTNVGSNAATAASDTSAS